MNVIATVSGMNWLCIKLPDGRWLPVFKLTDEQAREYSECTEILLRVKKVTIDPKRG